MTPTLPALLGLVVALSAVALGLAVRAHGRALRARHNIAILDRLGSGEAGAPQELLYARPQRLAHSARMQRFLHNLPFVPELAEMLEQSGEPTTVAMLLLRMLLMVGGTLSVGLSVGLDIAPAFILGVFGAVLPLFLVARAKIRRAAAFEAQLPQALDLIALYLRSGRSLPQAFLGATEELLPPAAEEFAICADEYRLGRPLDSSLKRLSNKYPGSVGFRLFSVAVTVLGQTGGNLVEVLERIKKTLDAGIAYGMKLKALTGESRMSAWILGSLPGLFLTVTALLNPAYFNAFFNTVSGQIMFGCFVGLWLGGILWIRNLVGSKA